MRLLQRVREDIPRGEHLEIYLTVLLSLTLAVLGVFEWYTHYQSEFDRMWEFGRSAQASDGFP